MALSKRQVRYWRREMEILDGLYTERMKQWQNLVDLHNLEFDQKIRDLDVSEMIRVPVFYTVCRQLIAAIAFNYPKLFVTGEDDEGEGFPISDILERASSAFLRLANVKPHVHQAIFDALPCGIGWLRVDYNPPGDDHPADGLRYIINHVYKPRPAKKTDSRPNAGAQVIDLLESMGKQKSRYS